MLPENNPRMRVFLCFNFYKIFHPKKLNLVYLNQMLLFFLPQSRSRLTYYFSIPPIHLLADAYWRNTYLLHKCLLNRGPTMCQALCHELRLPCPFGTHSPTHRMTLLWLLRSRYRLHLSPTQTAARDMDNVQGHCPSICHFSKYLKTCYYFWYWFVLNLSKEDAARISIYKLWWRSRS